MVTGGDGRLVATLRANGRSLPGQHIPDAQTQG
jgi:acyl-CoA thioesterase